jgi:hypothetical protein
LRWLLHAQLLSSLRDTFLLADCWVYVRTGALIPDVCMDDDDDAAEPCCEV